MTPRRSSASAPELIPGFHRRIPPLFAELFDDAALFPPGSAALPDAVRARLTYRTTAQAELVGPFICPAIRLSELLGEVGDHLDEFGPISITLPNLELPVEAMTQRSAYAEIAVNAAQPKPVAALGRAGLRLKLRTGGSSAATFPSAADLGAAIATAVEAEVPFKCTAGLHNALRHTDDETGFEHHGFFNVLLAVHAAQHGLDPVAILEERDPEPLLDQIHELSPTECAHIRGAFTAIGSCSIEEPWADLVVAGLVDDL